MPFLNKQLSTAYPSSSQRLQNRPWSEKISAAVKHCRLVLWEWKKSGSSTNQNDDTVKNMRLAKKSLKREQRQEAAKRGREKAEEIMKSQNDSKMFYKLVQNQRKAANKQLNTLVVDDKICQSPEEIRDGWAKHFQKLATPQENPNFDNDYKEMADQDIEIIEMLCQEENSPMDPVTVAEVTSALKRLNNNKAVDIMHQSFVATASPPTGKGGG